MAFYADVYGYIAQKGSGGIPPEVLEQVCRSTPMLQPCFSTPVASKGWVYISFACRIKLDEGEDELWLAPFEMVLKRIDFVHVQVNFCHEESSHRMEYVYVRDQGTIRKFCARLVEQSLVESIIPDGGTRDGSNPATPSGSAPLPDVE
jgi:hypothetical protein